MWPAAALKRLMLKVLALDASAAAAAAAAAYLDAGTTSCRSGTAGPSIVCVVRVGRTQAVEAEVERGAATNHPAAASAASIVVVHAVASALAEVFAAASVPPRSLFA